MYFSSSALDVRSASASSSLSLLCSYSADQALSVQIDETLLPSMQRTAETYPVDLALLLLCEILGIVVADSERGWWQDSERSEQQTTSYLFLAHDTRKPLKLFALCIQILLHADRTRSR